ncbi:fimbrial protein [Serratia proteamaculans]|uniref:Fimbrial protein n=1 Tax=Serratia proteamaculans TaxID=28151 RepID=A0A5Q2VBS7_SERPR|nr:fimbrial protein [Serratia proteamaculans]QGH61590.1 fimbrial protein [Serratia proteamaculans]
MKARVIKAISGVGKPVLPRVWGLALAGLLAFPLTGQTNVKISISGTVVATARCSFADGKPITVEFGDVYISDIAAGVYRQPLSYKVACSGDADSKTIQMQLSGDGAAFDNKLLKTDVKGLGIELLWDKSQMEVGKWYDLDPAAPPTLEGELVKQKGADFSNGQEFKASATLKVAYN